MSVIAPERPTTDVEVSEEVQALRKARDLIIEEDNWTKGALYDQEVGAYCALGAISYSFFDDPSFTRTYSCADNTNYNEALAALADVIIRKPSMKCASHYDDYEIIFTYNDEYATHDDIIAVFDEAIEELLNEDRRE